MGINLRSVVSIPLVALLAVAANYLLGCTDSEIKTNHYQTYTDALNDRAVQRGWYPKLIPASAIDIKEQHDLDTNQVWIRFRISTEDKKVMLDKMRKLTNDEIRSLEIITPKVDGWWFGQLAGQEPKTEGEKITDVYVGTCENGSIYERSYLVIDRENSYLYYWCGP